MSFFFRYSQENDPSFLDVAKKMMPSLFSMVKKMPIFFKHGQENDFFFFMARPRRIMDFPCT
jgi:hypothetical protein